MIDPVSISAIVVAILTALGTFIAKVHLKKCSALCIKSDCTKTPPPSPPPSPAIPSSPRLKRINPDIKVSEITI